MVEKWILYVKFGWGKVLSRLSRKEIGTDPFLADVKNKKWTRWDPATKTLFGRSVRGRIAPAFVKQKWLFCKKPFL
jgi:hypothetical protein